MRVAYVCNDPGVPVFGTKGCSAHVREVIRAMRRRGMEVELLTPRLGGAPPPDLADIRVIQLPLPRTPDVANRERQLIASDRQLSVELHRRGSFDMIYERYSLWSSAAMSCAADTGTASILEVNAPLIEEQVTHRSLVDMASARSMTLRAFRDAGTVVAVSDAMAAYVDSFRVARQPARVQPNAVNPGEFDVAAERVLARQRARTAGSSAKRIVIGFIGTLRPWHGMEILGKAFRRLRAENPNLDLLIVGDGPARNELLDALGSEQSKVRITGKIDHAEVPLHLAQMDIAVAPYPALADFYFSPLKLFEYMACGLPIVASRIGDIPKVLSDHISGRLVEPGNVVEMSKAIGGLIEQPETAMGIGQHARALVHAKYSWDQCLTNMLRYACDHGNRTDVVSSSSRSAG